MPDQPHHIILFKDANFHGAYKHIFDQDRISIWLKQTPGVINAAAYIKQDLPAMARPAPPARFWCDLELPTSATRNPRCSSRW
jgi:hypothetical protein